MLAVLVLVVLVLVAAETVLTIAEMVLLVEGWFRPPDACAGC